MAANVEIVLQLDNQTRVPLRQVKGDLNDLGTTGQKSTGLVGKGLSSIGAIAGGAALAGVTALAGGVASFMYEGFTGAVALEEQMSGIAAVLGLTAEEAEPLKTLIQDLGLDPNLKIDSEGAAAAIEMLARNGLNMDQILDGAARSAILLSNATGGDLSNAADITTDAIAQFNLQVSDTESVVDGITGVVNNSKLSMDDYGMALANAGGIAGAVGVEIEDFNTSIAATSSLFSSGADAGTSYKTFLQRLIPASSSAYDEMAKLGLITEDGTNRFFDQTGALKDQAEIVDILNKATSGLSEEQRNQAFSTIFGTDAMRTAVGLAGMTKEEYEALSVAINENTSAAENAATRVNNLSGDWEIFKDGISAFATTVMDNAVPAVRDLVQGATEAFGIFTQFFGRIQEGFPPMAALHNALFQLAELFGFSSDEAAGFAAGVTGIITSVQDFITNIQTAFSEGGIGGLIDLMLEGLSNLATSIQEWIAGVDWYSIGSTLAEYLIQGVELWVWLETKLFEFYTALYEWFINQDWNATGGVVTTALANLWAGFSETIGPILQGWWDTFVNWFASVDWMGLATTAVTAIIDGYTTFMDRVRGKLTEWHNAFVEWVNNADWEGIAQTATEAIINGLTNFVTMVGDTLVEWFNAFGDWAENADWEAIGKSIVAGVIYIMSGQWASDIVTTVSEWYDSMSSETLGIDWAGIGGSIIQGVISGIGNAAGALVSAFTDAVQRAWDAGRELLGANSPAKNLIPLGESMDEGVEVGIANRSNSLASTFTGALQNATQAATTNIQNNKTVTLNFNVNANSFSANRGALSALALVGGP